MIEFEHVTKRYPERGDALRDLSFKLEPAKWPSSPATPAPARARCCA
jgi:hypothetical protein